MYPFTAFVATLAFTALVNSIQLPDGGEVTPHMQYGSTLGVLGCKIDRDRIAFWPWYPVCDKMCIKITANGRSVYVLHIDQSAGAYDISYAAYAYLKLGQFTSSEEAYGGKMKANYEFAPMDQCIDILIDNGTLPMLAKSPNYYIQCKSDPWLKDRMTFWNLDNDKCYLGIDEQCYLSKTAPNSFDCPSGQSGTNKPNCDQFARDRTIPGQYTDRIPGECPTLTPAVAQPATPLVSAPVAPTPPPSVSIPSIPTVSPPIPTLVSSSPVAPSVAI